MDSEKFCEIFHDVLPVLSKAAPLLAGFIGTPATGIIVALLGVLANVDPCNHCKIAEKLSSDPDLFSKLKNLENTHLGWLKTFENIAGKS